MTGAASDLHLFTVIFSGDSCITPVNVLDHINGTGKVVWNMMPTMTRIFRILYRFPVHLSYNERYEYVVNNYIYTFSITGHILFTPLFIHAGNNLVIFNNILCVGLDALCFWLNTHSRMRASFLLWILEISYHATVSSIALGWDQGYCFYHIALAGIIFLTRQRVAVKIIVSLSLFFLVGVLFEYSRMYPPVTVTDIFYNKLLFYFNTLASFSGLGFIGYSHHRVMESQQHKLLHQATHDMLTGIHNRQALIERLSAEFNRSRRTGSPFSLIMSDLDFFKKINDTWGHQFGDTILVHAARILKDSLRPYDFIARYGGEEFVIILPGCTLAQASDLAERLRRGIEDAMVEHDGVEIHLTMSFGLVNIQAENPCSIEEALHMADRALYRAKDNGRNRVEGP
ncbi:MAG: hypothetical protein CVV44_14170 [Spirochaetae bacterium HGW-Spirochaetae-1]|nr:MAG: hypothetical protein CVV44_14170 [Spirochaetae bacterium HGW-Spirochaetae-1]